MAVGSHCLFEGSSTRTEPGTSFQDFNPDWIEILDPDAVYSVVSGNIRVAEAGRYLVTYGWHFNADGNGRTNQVGQLRKNLTPIEGSLATGYESDSANDELFVRGQCIIDLAANDNIDIQWRRDGDSQTGSTIANEQYIQLVRLTDSADTAYARYADNNQTLAFGGTTFTSIAWNLIREETDTAVIQRNGSGPGVNLKGAIGDRFLVLYSITWQIGGDRTQRVTRATLAGSQINGTHSYVYQRNAANEFGSCVAAFIVEKASASNEELLIEARRGASGEADVDGSALRRINSSGLFIMKLLPTTEACGFHDATGGEDYSGNASPNLFNIWNNEDFRDAASFVRTDADTLTVQKTNAYIFMANVKGARTGTSSIKALYQSRWRVAGSNVREGQHGNYTRGEEGTTDTFGGSVNNLGILNLTVNNTVELDIFTAGDIGSTDLTTANEVGGFAINAGTLAVVVAPVTHTTDSILKKLDNEITHTTDSFLVNIITLTHTTDSVLKALDQIEIHTTDSVLKALDQIETHTTDSVLRAIDNEITHTTDSFLVSGVTVVTETHTTDSILKAIQTEDHTTDSVLKLLDNEITHTTDSVLVNVVLVTHTTDSVLKTLDQTISHTTDSVLKALDQEITHTTDSFLVSIVTLTHTTDSVLKALDNEINHTTDSVLKALDNEISHTTDSHLLAEKILTHTTDSFLAVAIGPVTVTHTTDSVLKKLDTEITHTTDSKVGFLPIRQLEVDLCR